MLTDDSLKEEIKIKGLNKGPAEFRQMSVELLPKLANTIYEFWSERRQQFMPDKEASLS